MVVALRNTNYESPKGFGVGFGSPIPARNAFAPPTAARLVSKSGNNLNRAPQTDENAHINKWQQSSRTRVAPTYSAPLVKQPTHQFFLSTTYSIREPPVNAPKACTRSGGFNKVLLQNPYAGKKLLTHGLPDAPPSRKRPAQKKRKVSATRTENTRKEPAAIGRIIGKASSLITEKTFQYLENLEERRRKETSKRRISECLVNLRAASERSASLREFQTGSTRPRSNSLRDIVGDVGLALFSPLDLEAFEPLDKTHVNAEDNDTDGQQEEPVEYPIDMVPELQSVLSSCPRLLTPIMLQQLMDHLPPTVQTMTWRRLFSLGRDGDSFLIMLDRCHSYSNTVIVMETSDGHVLGGYASAPWDKQIGTIRSFYGSGQSFLFATHPDGTDHSQATEGDDKIYVYPWTGNNNYCQVCDVDEGQMAMGGGGSFGLIVQENFSRGSTGQCSTFGNPALIPSYASVGGTFDVVDFEIYGFSSMVEAFTPSTSTETQTKQLSLLRSDSPMLDRD
ncbi:hypothetical protein MHU86_4184 [Fragilaria crotonensis]|nr:hypothetical protein MHU86_4184 [Fragilaria crotonensis]